MASAPAPPKSSRCAFAALRRIRNVDFTPTPRSQDYPPVSSLRRTSHDRLARASPKPCPEEPLPSASPLVAPYLADATSSTVLYLAYGSNLCAQTFLGQRGIRPLSAVNVSAPSLRLTFDLPGIAYKEPCFANTAPRKIPKPPKIPPGLPDPPSVVPHPPPGFSLPPPAQGVGRESAPGDPQWDGGLIGVVYEVTPEDYATIVKTEGGGSSYQDILVPCIPIPTRPPGIPEDPSYPGLPKPFLAHTLYAPRIPNKPGDDGDDGDDGDGDGDGPLGRLRDWWKNLLLKPVRPDPEYAQPSARYLKLIVDGAAEHDLPAEYQRYLASLQPYTITTRLQAVGQFLFLALVAPWMVLYIGLSRILADDDGKAPVWLALAIDTLFHLTWGAYDRWFKPLFGDGERTIEQGEDVKSRPVVLMKREAAADEEKLRPLNHR